MNILILNWKDIKHPQVGGAEIIVYELAKRLVKDGHAVTWFCRNFKGGEAESSIDGIKIVRRGNLITTYLFAPIYYWAQKIKPNIVIDISNTVYWQSPLWAWKSKKIAYLNQLAKDVFYYEYPLIVSRLGIFLEKIQYITYKKTRFVCYANSTKTDLISAGVDPKKITLFSLGLDHDRYMPGVKSKTPLFVCINRLVKMKRTDLAIKAMKLLVAQYPEAKLIIVGTGYERSYLENLRNSLSVEKNVFFADESTWFFEKNSNDKKVMYMQQAWALIFPSVKEGWGMTVTECAACKTPSIVTNVTGLVDSVRNGKTGTVISSNPTPKELCDALCKYIKNPTFRKNQSEQAKKWSNEFSWDKSYKEFKDIIESL